MRSLTLTAVLAATALAAAGCNRAETSADGRVGDATPAESAGTDAAATPQGPAPDTGFTVAQVPMSTATLPPMPMFTAPEGLTSVFSEGDRRLGFDAENFIAGDRIVTIEGQVWRDTFPLQPEGGRFYSELEFRRNYQNAIEGLGGVKINTSNFTPEMIQAFGGEDRLRQHFHGGCVGPECTIDTYLIRQGDQEYWIMVQAGGVFPPHGFVVVVQREAMIQSVGYLNADQMLAAIEANGRVALDINFDFDRATLRPEGERVVAEITRLLTANPNLRLSIEGHTDNVGTAERNRALSGERAETVRAALIAQGIAADRLFARGFGADRPLVGNDTDEGRARNRRVELVRVQ